MLIFSQMCKFLTNLGVSRTSERRASRASVHSASSRTSKSQKPKQEKSGPTKAAVTPGVPPGYQDDTYGIPILELSSDTDVSETVSKQVVQNWLDIVAILN